MAMQAATQAVVMWLDPHHPCCSVPRESLWWLGTIATELKTAGSTGHPRR
jgi:hypothetical protein